MALPLLLLTFLAPPALAMYDVILDATRSRPPAECPKGCAAWADLARDGNTRSQAAVNAKFRQGVPPATAGRACAMPAYDPGESGPGWCYCRSSGDDSWGYCMDPVGSVPEQINLQLVSDTSVTVAFVTVDSYAASSPVLQLSTSPSLASPLNVSGVTNFWTQVGSSRQYSFHFVLLTDLAPATAYYYRVTSGAAGALWSPVYPFSTRDPSKELTFAIFGDMGSYPVNNMDTLANDTEISFIVHMGDHAYQMSSDDGMRGDGYMIAWERVLSRVPWATVMGNHVSASSGERMFSVRPYPSHTLLPPHTLAGGV